MPASRATRPVTAADALLIVLGGALAALYWHAPYAGSFGRTLAVIAVQLALFGAAGIVVARARQSRVTLAIVLGCAALFRVAALDYTPILSSDVYRYVWDGRVQAAGINPYLYVPAAPALETLRDDAIYPNINRREVAATIYPPLAEMLFYAVTRVHDSVYAMRVAMVGFEAIAIAGLVALLGRLNQPRTYVVFIAWHPLAVWEIASSGHLDAVVLAAMAAAFLAHEQGRSRLAVVVIGLAALVKLYPLALLPAFWSRRDWIALGAVATIAAAAYAPYAIGAGWGVLGYLPGYLAEEGFRTGDRFFLIDLARRVLSIEIAPRTYVLAAAAGLGGLALAMVATGPRRGAGLVKSALALSTAATVAVSPSYPWYFLWLLPCLAVVPSVPLIVLTAAGFVQYVRFVPGSTATSFDLHVVQYLGFAGIALAAGLVHLLRARTHAVLTGDPA